MNVIESKQIKNEKYCWEKSYPIAYYEMDYKKALKPSALLNFLQDMATQNAEMLGFGPSFIFPKNYAWFLIKYRMEFDEYPCDLDSLIVKTEARGISKILANRDFEVWSPDNAKRLCRVASSWMLIDLSNKNILPLAKVIDFMPNMQKREDDLGYAKIPALNSIDAQREFEIRYDDIDVNRHVNNANYIIWALEALDWDFRAQNTIKTLDIVYKKEISYGNTILSQVEIDLEQNTTLHVLKNAQTLEELCFLSIQWA